MDDHDRESGFIVLHRQLLSSAVWTLPDAQFKTFIALLFAANWKATTVIVWGRTVIVARGEALIAVRTLAERARVSRGAAERALRILLQLGVITERPAFKAEERVKAGTVPRVYFFPNYDRFQTIWGEDRDASGPAVEQGPGQQRASDRADQKAVNTVNTGNTEKGVAGATTLALLPTLASEPNLFTIGCVGNGPREYGITQSMLLRWQAAFPGVDAEGEARKMQFWLEQNPTKRKTFKGMGAFVTRWLSRAQDRGGSPLPTPRGARGGLAPSTDHPEESGPVKIPR